MRTASHGIRRNALEKLAALSVKAQTGTSSPSDLDRLCRLYSPPNSSASGIASNCLRHGSTSKTPMGLRELETLLALCRAAPSVDTVDNAHLLLHQLSPYLPEAHTQALSPSPFLRDFHPSPWETLTCGLTSAILSLGLNHPTLRDQAASVIVEYIQGCANGAETLTRVGHRNGEQRDEIPVGQSVEAMVLVVSLLGFLDAATEYARFWTVHERLKTIQEIRRILSEDFMVALEESLSTIRNSHSSKGVLREWKRYSKSYAADGRPLGAMLLRQGYMQFVTVVASLLVVGQETLQKHSTLGALLSDQRTTRPRADVADYTALESLTDLVADEISFLEADSDYLQLSSAWQQQLAFAVKGCTLTTFLCCSVANHDIADTETLVSWLETTIADPIQMADENLAQVVLRCMAVLAKSSSALASNISRSLPRFIVQGGLNSRTAAVAAECLAFVLKLLSQDAIITTLYSLGNVLSASTGADGLPNPLPFHDSSMSTHQSTGPYGRPSTGSAISLALSDAEETSVVYGIVVQAIVGIASSCKDDKITALAISMLIQKFGRVNLSVDAKILAETAILGVHCGPSELRSLLKLYSYLSHNALIQHNSLMLAAVLNARNYLSRGIKKGSPLYEIYLVHLLDAVISKGDAHETENGHMADVDLAAKEITQLLEPLAVLVSLNASSTVELQDGQAMLSMQRDAWFNIVVHGFSPMSPLGKKYQTELKILAQYSHPLVAEERADQVESDIELNTVLRRGMNPNHMAEQKRQLAEFLPSCEADIRGLSYPEVVFLSAANLVAHLQARAGDPTKTRMYFLEPKLRSGAMGSCMNAIAISAVDVYLSKTLAGHDQIFSTPHVAQQLATFFAGCCHRISRVQHVSIACTDRIISQIPSALCQKSSLFALLELLSIMWTSCLEAETDQYESKSIYSSSRGNVSVELSDDYEFRRFTLVELHKRAKGWVGRVMDVAPLDVKGLLQTYLSEYDDEGAYGHVSLGRSFALEMGSAIVSTDQRLGAIDDRQRGLNINTASDFIAQYTTRQEYRYADAVPEDDREWLGSNVPARRTDLRLEQRAEDAMALLRHLESRTLQRVHVSIAELRDALKRAASLLCRAERDHGAIVHHLVSIPFTVFTKQSIKLGISLWMGVIKENPRMESRILCEIAASWENTIHKKLGLFNERFQHLDPFYVKEEFAPTDKDALMKRQQLAHNLTAPHFRLLQFLSSHFNATRLCNPYVERAYHRLMRITLSAMKHTTSQPLAREVHFHVVLLGLRILRHSTSLDTGASWRLKDQILSAGLVWFYRPPRWSYGGNKIQMRAEVKLLADVAAALQTVAAVGTKPTPSLVSLQSKQDLLLLLLGNEQTRLTVWLLPFGADQERKHHFLSGGHDTAPTEAALSALLRTAWAESPALAVQLTTRFQSPRLASDVRWQVLNSPEKVLDEPDALHVLLGTSMPTDVSSLLKYLLFWAPVNPITAVTYFLPAYGNHPFIIQYAMRALEGHSVDVTFFYVPQIVQTLRYDVLGYVKRYIIETAKFSQLFAHQIIWNMKANAFKDEDSQVPDPVKPTLDMVMEALINSFSGADKLFYEREFTFFNEVTDISGKLRPFIMRPKPEKKQKIEEELRKIQVEVGVYLPSNPDGVVVGIDRKSGKPLQSHAKAPYMATFRIRKEKGDMEAFENEVSEVSQNGTISKETTYEVWQSAIFKVGDDCRQDVLALQMIAAFRGIFNSVGLDVYVFPYRVTATAPGCGVIDVLPNSISRDMLGREAVNGLYDYFISKYGGEDSLRFQEARGNFVKSMAAYSVISYLLQFKDRHNGNIMIDDAGHILHIDFGFCFDIAPGGVKFERAPFKLTAEMVAVMGGSTSAQPYHWFEELCVKSFLAVRPYVEALSHLVIVMLDSGLPCFKPQTIQHFKERFVPQKTEREAADFMRGLVDKSYRSYSTKGYDQFQLLTNGIPY